MSWHSLPSLAALRAFDALARSGSLSAAGRRLNVTHAAIAQHLRGLEAHFGTALAERDGKAMRLTDTGRTLAASLAEGFDTISDGVARVEQAQAEAPVQVTLTASFAEAWLMPRIGDFWQAHPDVDLRLVPSNKVLDLRRDQIDLAIRFCTGATPGLDAIPLALHPFVVVAAPGVVAPGSDISKATWIVTPIAHEVRIVSQRIGLDLDRVARQEVPNNAMAISAVRAGLGLSIQSRALVEADLAAGRLVALREAEAGGYGYYIVTRPGLQRPSVKAFMRWLKSYASTPQV